MKMISLTRISLQRKTVSSMVFAVAGLTLAAAVFGDVMSVSGKSYFFSVPIPCKEYLALKRYQEETNFYQPGSLFQAKVRIEGDSVPQSEGARNVKVQVVEVLEGKVPADHFVVHWSGTVTSGGLPSSYAEKNFHYIMGGVLPDGFKVMGDVWHGGDVLLASSDMRKWESQDGGARSGLWGWLQGLFSECQSVK